MSTFARQTKLTKYIEELRVIDSGRVERGLAGSGAENKSTGGRTNSRNFEALGPMGRALVG